MTLIENHMLAKESHINRVNESDSFRGDIKKASSI